MRYSLSAIPFDVARVKELSRPILEKAGARGDGPATLVDPVSGDDLRSEAAEMLVCNRERLSSDLSWFKSTYGQASGVLVGTSVEHPAEPA
jgi:hypothetical protein